MIRGYRRLPDLVMGALLTSEGYLVGSAAESVANNKVHEGDYDIIVPDYNRYMATVKLLTGILDASYDLNSFGGMKVEFRSFGDPIVIDIWPDSLDTYIRVTKTSTIYDFKSNSLIQITR